MKKMILAIVFLFVAVPPSSAVDYTVTITTAEEQDIISLGTVLGQTIQQLIDQAVKRLAEKAKRDVEDERGKKVSKFIKDNPGKKTAIEAITGPLP